MSSGIAKSIKTFFFSSLNPIAAHFSLHQHFTRLLYCLFFSHFISNLWGLTHRLDGKLYIHFLFPITRSHLRLNCIGYKETVTNRGGGRPQKIIDHTCLCSFC